MSEPRKDVPPKVIERRYIAPTEIRIKREADQSPRIVGHAAVFNELSEDLGGFREQIARGAFTEALEKDDVRALFNHNPDHVLGRNRAGTLKLAEDAHGLAVDINPPDTGAAADLIVLLERGDVTQMSFAFSIRPNGEDWAKNDDGIWIRTIKRVRLYDVSPVTYPAYTSTDVAVRALEQVRIAQAPASAAWRVKLKLRELALLG